MPGIMPAANNLPILVWVKIPYMTNKTLGGISIPSVPPAAIEPAAKPSSYPNLRMEGMATLDIVAAVARDEPHTALKPPQATTVAMASPPLRCPRNAFDAVYNSSDNRALVTKFPIRINKGTTESS